MDGGAWTVDDGRWTMDHGPWTMDGRPWSMVEGPASITAPLRMFRGVFLVFYPCHPVNPRHPRSVFPWSIVHGPRSGIELVLSMVYAPVPITAPLRIFRGLFLVFIRVIRLIRVIRVLFYHGLSSMVHGPVLSSCGLSSMVQYLSPRPCVYFTDCFSVFIRVIRLIRVLLFRRVFVWFMFY
jgi:hypothetical protein